LEVELRVDVDGSRPTGRVSADYFRSEGATSTYVGSMRVDDPVVTVTQSRITIRGAGSFTMPTKHTRVQVTIPRVWEGATPAPATLRHYTKGGASGSVYKCAFASPSFRTVYAEEAREQAVTPLSSYDSGSLPAGGAARELTPFSAYAEAGIEVLHEHEPVVVDSAGAGVNAAWNDAELHAAMQLSFSRWADSPQWAIWLLHAVTHEDPDIFGLMFDRHGLQRQGCAVFYQGLRPSTPELARELLHVCVHELGHGFNLRHCWQRSLDEPPVPSRPAAASWMNYPERFPGGRDAYWSKFAFEFDDVEVVHLRHAFRDSVIMGGDPFAGAAAYDRSGRRGSERPGSERQDRGLRLKLLAPRALAQGVPVTVGFELSATLAEGRSVPAVLGPRSSTVDIAIRDPLGEESLFEPLLRHCRNEKELVSLRAGGPPARDYAFIHYGKHGFSFENPGLYRVRARYTAPDGSLALSDEVTIRVRRPESRVEREVARLIDGDEQVGTLMSLVGSDARELRDGNEKLRTIIERYPTHPVADIARVVRGTNLARGFKLMQPDGSLSRRAPDVVGAAQLIATVVDVGPLLRSGRAIAAPAPDVRAPTPPLPATRRGVADAVDAFVRSRNAEVSGAVGALRQASDRRRLDASRKPPPQGRRQKPDGGSRVTVNTTKPPATAE